MKVINYFVRISIFILLGFYAFKTKFVLQNPTFYDRLLINNVPDMVKLPILI